MDSSPFLSNPSLGNTDYLTYVGQQLLATWRQRESGTVLDQVLNEVIEQAHALFPEQITLVSLYIYRETGLLYLEQVDGALAALIQTRTAHPQGAAAVLVNRRTPFFVESIQQWPTALPPIADHMVASGQIQAYVGLPLMIGLCGQEEVVGALLISLRAPQRFDPARRQALWRWAQQVALFVQNARVIRRRRREEEAFQAISTSANAGNPLEVAEVIARQVRGLTKCAFVAVLAHLPQAQCLASYGTVHYGDAEQAGMIQLDLRQRSINSHVLETRMPYYAPDLSRDPYNFIYYGWDHEMQAAYCMPLLVHREVIGTIYLTSTSVDGIAADDRNFIEKLAPHAAIALHHATLMRSERTQREDQARELAEVRDYAIATEAVAWFGITAADRQHTLAQKLGSLRYCTDTLQAWAQLQGIAGDECIQEIIQDLNSVADEIQVMKSQTTGTPTEMPTVVDKELRRSVQRWCDEYNRLENAAIQCRFALACDGLKIQVPPNILRIATEKVVHNALKAMKSTGVLTVATQPIGNEIVIDFADTGPGIPDFARAHFLKRPIQRPPDAPGQGTGMGAHMARIVARRYRGDLTLLETSPTGATLRLTFPVYGSTA